MGEAMNELRQLATPRVIAFVFPTSVHLIVYEKITRKPWQYFTEAVAIDKKNTTSTESFQL